MTWCISGLVLVVSIAVWVLVVRSDAFKRAEIKPKDDNQW